MIPTEWGINVILPYMVATLIFKGHYLKNIQFRSADHEVISMILLHLYRGQLD